jgi:Fur family peroxide stress response transcriptional regulator
LLEDNSKRFDMNTTKYRRQRETIKEYLMKTKDHPSADMVYAHLRNEIPNISLGTVYRNLNLLVSQGEAVKLTFGNGPDRFDGNVRPHYHFVCTECYNIDDLEISNDDIKLINDIASRNYAGEIRGHYAYFFGKCGSCKEH